MNADANLVRRGRFLSTTFLMEVGDQGYLVKIIEGRIVSVTPGPFVTPNYSFALRAPRDEWEMFWKKMPAPGHNDIFALFKRGKLTHRRRPASVHGEPALHQGRAGRAAPRKEAAAMSPRFEPITGRYLQLELLGRPHRLYIEEAGQGIPLLCLHTAGSDGRQYRGLLNDKRITDNYRVIVFDMPWHGKSSPPEGYQNEEYKLTSRDYIQMILEIADALELDKPVVMGCSIGGRIALYLAHQHAKRFRAIIGLESAAHVAPYYDVEWLHRPDVHGGEVSAGVVSGLVAPTAPDNHRWETLWHYLQSGPGVFKGDLHFYKVDGDIRGKIDEIDGTRCEPLSAHRRIRLFLHHRRHARHRQAHRRAGDDHEGPRPFPDERGPAEVHRLSAAGAGEDPRRGVSSAPHRRTPCPTPKPSTPCSPPRARPTTIVQFAGALRYDALPEDARHYARRHLLDTVGVMIAGARRHHRDPGRERHQGGARRREKSRCRAAQRRADLLDAAFLGGTAAHGIELDDGYRHGSAHCGCVVIPAALSVGLRQRAPAAAR